MTEYPPIHAPSRPDWSCTACAEPWPCSTRKRQLRDLFQDNIAGLTNYLAQYLTDANVELGHLSTAEVTERFVEWCAPPRPVPRQRTPPLPDRAAGSWSND